VKNAREFGEKVFADAGIALGGSGPSDIVVHDHRFYDRVIADRELGLGESYQEGWWDANQLDEFLSTMITKDIASFVKPSAALLITAARSKILNLQTLGRAAHNAQAHYDIGNDLYERMLDKRMIYSCGYWADAVDLESAQVAKLDLVCRKLGLEPGMKLLDIGCGWGGFAGYAAERYGVDVVGISLAHEQVKVAAARTSHLNVDIQLQDYRKMTGSFDRIVSIGMFEHVGPKNYRAFFDHCDRLLTGDGVMLHHTIGGLESKTQTDPWFDKYVFPGGVLPSLAQIGRASEKKWVLEDLHNIGSDYDTTLMHWYANVSQAWDELPNYDEHFRRTWDYYLLASAAGFRTRSTQLWQAVFRRSKRQAQRYLTVR
jgi:cyclopropane-fatty-acyl-phospholipid synthase